MSAKKYCIVFGCKNHDKNWNFSFYSLPKDIERRRQWLSLIDREDLSKNENLKTKSYVVCSAHFEKSAIKEIHQLKNDAVPTKFLPNRAQEGSSCLEKPPVSTELKSSKITILSNKIVKRKTFQAVTQTELLNFIDKQTQTTNSVTAETPRKRKLLEELNESKLKCRRIEHEAQNIKQELEAKNESVMCNDPDVEITRRFQKLIDWQNKTKNKYKGNRYDAEYKLFALNLHYSSPHAYRCLQTILKLPCKSTLNRFKINIPPKLNDRELDSLALKLKSLPDAAKYCTICVDEMTLKRNLYYNVKTDEVTGFHNINGKITSEIASNAFVIMLQGIHHKWKQPIAYALLATAEHYEEIDLWMNEVIVKLSGIGIKVKAIVSDQGSNFDKFAKEVKKVTVEKPYFMYNNTKIYYVFDVPHLIKCIRNNLLTSDFFHDGNRISWSYIEELYKDQKERNLKLIPKLTDAHLQPNNFQKMRVKLAVQTLSRTVAAALHTYIDLGKFSEEARPTATFIESMNDLFDVLNSSKIKASNPHQTAFRLSKDQENVLNAAKEMFSSAKAINRKTGKNNTGHIKSFVNFQISIQAIKMLFKDLEKDGFKYLFTRRLNQDNLENFFGSVRQQGSCSEPTAIQFQRAFSKLFLCNIIKSSPYANCEMDICDILLKAEDMVKITLSGNDLPPQISAVSLRGETDYRLDLPDENALIYVASYLYFKCTNEHKCPAVNETLKSIPGLEETNLFSRYKAFNKKSGFFGSLKMPPKEFIQYVNNLETAFTENFDKVIQCNPGSELLKLFQAIPPQTPCSCFPLNYMLKLFARFRIFATIKFNNLQFKEGKKGIREYNIKISHL